MDELLKRLRHLLGADAVKVSYQRFEPPRVKGAGGPHPPKLRVVR
jgi:hypothetical protein